ncbi:MAG: hypothetical protein JO352_27435, partial [Chloroflexi bacterium]|nr:hypothetical protein [Chloroflexota bacterium]
MSNEAADNVSSQTPPPGGQAAQPAPPPVEVVWEPGQVTWIELDRVHLDLGADTFKEAVTLHLEVLQPVSAAVTAGTPGPSALADSPPIPSNFTSACAFRVQAWSQATRQRVRQLNQPLQLTFDYSGLSPADWGFTYPSLFTFDETAQAWTCMASRLDFARGQLVASVPQLADFSFGGDVNANPSAPPNIEGVAVDLCTGYASIDIPLKVPPGINGMEPKLCFFYNAATTEIVNTNLIEAGGNDYDNTRVDVQGSIVGLGWSIEPERIYRAPAGGTDG